MRKEYNRLQPLIEPRAQAEKFSREVFIQTVQAVCSVAQHLGYDYEEVAMAEGVIRNAASIAMRE